MKIIIPDKKRPVPLVIDGGRGWDRQAEINDRDWLQLAQSTKNGCNYILHLFIPRKLDVNNSTSSFTKLTG